MLFKSKKEAKKVIENDTNENKIQNVDNTKITLNQNKLKKYLYLEANELKGEYHNCVDDCKKLETKLKQIERDTLRVQKQLNNAKSNPMPLITDNKTQNTNSAMGILNDNPNELKQQIRSKRDVYDEHVELLDELKIKIKADNLLLLSNQCIYQQKLLLNKKQMINKLLVSETSDT